MMVIFNHVKHKSIQSNASSLIKIFWSVPNCTKEEDGDEVVGLT